LSKKKYFLSEFLKERKTVGSVTPSSPSLCKLMLKNVELASCRAIAEFGPGTGVFTSKILEEIPKDAKLLVFELHKAFFHKLEKEYRDHANVIVINDSAENIGKYMNENNISVLDAVISSLPLTNFDDKLTNTILKSSYESLKDEGLYIQFQYSLNARKKLKRIFNSVKINFTPKNIPPAFVYTCKK
jgi:phospholipid N-methyltransferase